MSNNVPIPMTPEGKKKIEAELGKLKSVDRPKVVQQLIDARAHGDISENAEYEAAKDRQGWVEGRINELEDKLARAVVIDPAMARTDLAVFGSRVTLEETSSKRVTRYLLVGPEESDVKEGKISIQSPLGKAMLGKKPGDLVELEAPAGFKEYKIVTIDAAD